MDEIINKYIPKETFEKYLIDFNKKKNNHNTLISSFENISLLNSDFDSYNNIDVQLSDYSDDENNEFDNLIYEFKKLNKDDRCFIINKINELNNKYK